MDQYRESHHKFGDIQNSDLKAKLEKMKTKYAMRKYSSSSEEEEPLNLNLNNKVLNALKSKEER